MLFFPNDESANLRNCFSKKTTIAPSAYERYFVFLEENLKTKRIMETKDKVLEAMKQAGEPLNAGKIAEISGIDRKEVDKAMKQLKEEGAIVSPKRCYWEPAK